MVKSPFKPPPRKPRGASISNPLMRNARDWDRDKVMDVVCNAIASSSKSIASILAEGYEGHALPEYVTISKWIAEEKSGLENEYRKMYARAKEAQAEFMAEELAELHNKAWVPVLDPETGMPMMVGGKPVMTVDKASAALVRLEAENKKWLMAKLKPKRYGDKVTQEIVGPNGGPIQLTDAQRSALDRVIDEDV